MMLESVFQANLIREIQEMLPNSIIIKSDPSYIQGFPDLIILHNQKWAALEVKRSSKSKRRPNQEAWVRIINGISFASVIYPENKEEVLRELQQKLRTS